MSIINNVLSKVLGSRNDRLIKKYSDAVAKINSLEPEIQSLSDDELSSMTKKLRDRIQNKENLEGVLPEAFAAVRAVSYTHLTLPTIYSV